MALIEKSVEVYVPVPTAYNQWTPFEEFPKFMDGVIQVPTTRQYPLALEGEDRRQGEGMECRHH
ncbi:MAG: Cyclase/dehydrase [Nitrospira sp.]|jgi:hypothetical protein|nr:Cyclase/dehydrase [Nitrospira sp.]